MRRLLAILLLCSTICSIEVTAQNRRFQSSLDLGMQLHNGDYYSFAPSISYTAGYRGGEFFFVGLGAGVSFVADSNFYPFESNNSDEYRFYIDYHTEGESKLALPQSKFSLPIFLQMRAYITDNRVRPFFLLSLGGRLSKGQCVEIYEHVFGAHTNSIEYKTSSLFAEPMIGFNFELTRKLSINIQAGCTLQSAPYFGRFDTTRGITTQQLSIGYTAKLGLSF